MLTNDKLNENAIIDQFSELLSLTDVQVEKLRNLTNMKNFPEVGNISMTLELDSNDQGFVPYSRQITTIVPIKFNATGVLTFPKEGEWHIKVFINGGLIFQKAGVKQGEAIAISGWTGWGTSNLVVEAQWSIIAKTHVSINISI